MEKLLILTFTVSIKIVMLIKFQIGGIQNTRKSPDH